MAHYALINEKGIVVNVITGVDENVTQKNEAGANVGGSSEAWEKFYTDQLGDVNLFYKRTSYSGSIRFRYAGVGFTYDKDRDAFIAPKPENLGNDVYFLDESSLEWIKTNV